MGASVSTNTSSILTTASNKIVYDITQKANKSGTQRFGIKAIDVEGNVIINGLRIDQSNRSHFKGAIAALSKTENEEKFKEEIAQAAKSLISGLNLANISVSTSSINNVIKNCIEIVNKNAAQCEAIDTQEIGIDTEHVKGDVVITNSTVNQVLDSFVNCLLNSSDVTSLTSAIDYDIKQVTSTKTEGLDVKWIAIAIALGIGGVSFAGAKALSTMLGPGMILAGAGLTYYSINSQNNHDTEYKNDYHYILNDVGDYYVDFNKSDTQTIPSIPKDPTIYKHEGKQADVYEFSEFEGNKIVVLYNGISNAQLKELNNLQSEKIERNDLIFNFTAEKKDLLLSIKNSKKYARVEILRGLTYPISKYNVLPEKVKNIKQIYSTGDDTIDLDISNFNYTHTINMYKQGIHVAEYHLVPTLISYKNVELTEYYKKPMFLIGIGLMGVGLLMTLMSHSKGKNK